VKLSKPKKPPLGVMPRQIWLMRRAKDLADGIKRYLDAGYYITSVQLWCDELIKLIDEIGNSIDV